MDRDQYLKTGQTIAKARKALGFSQVKFAEKSGLNLRHFQNIEAGKVDVRLSTLLQIAKVLQLSPCQLLEANPKLYSVEYQEPIFGRLLDDLFHIVVVTDTNGKIKYLNKAFFSVVGMATEEFTDKKFIWQIAAGEYAQEKFKKKFKELVEDQSSGSFPSDLHTKSGNSVGITIQFRPIKDVSAVSRGFLFGISKRVPPVTLSSLF